MKKTLIIIGVIILVISASWFGWSRIGKAPTVNLPNSDETNVGMVNNEVATSTGNTTQSQPVPLAEGEKLQQEALRIVNRNILVQVSLSAAAESQARNKIQELISMLRENYDTDAQWLDLGSYRRLIGDYEGARDALEFLAKIRPKSYVVFHNLGDLYAYQFKNYPKAEEYFLKSITYGPGNIQGYIQLVTLYQYLDKSKASEIEPLLLKGITVNSQDSNLRVTLAEYYKDQGRNADALKYFEEALRLNPKNTSLQQEIELLKNS